MYEWIADTFGVGDGIARAMSFIIALAIVFALIGLMVHFLRQFTGNRINAGRNRQPRIAVMDAMNIDTRRRLLLVRRDNVEHLILVGGPTDVVVEQAIVRGTPVTASYPRQMAAYGTPDYETEIEPVPVPVPVPVSAPAVAPQAAPAPAQPVQSPVAAAAPIRTQAQAASGPQRLAAGLAARAAAAAGSLAASARQRIQAEPAAELQSKPQPGLQPQAAAPVQPQTIARVQTPPSAPQAHPSAAPAAAAQAPSIAAAPQPSIQAAPQPAAPAAQPLKPVTSPLDTIKTLRARAAEAMSTDGQNASAPAIPQTTGAAPRSAPPEFPGRPAAAQAPAVRSTAQPVRPGVPEETSSASAASALTQKAGASVAAASAAVAGLARNLTGSAERPAAAGLGMAQPVAVQAQEPEPRRQVTPPSSGPAARARTVFQNPLAAASSQQQGETASPAEPAAPASPQATAEVRSPAERNGEGLGSLAINPYLRLDPARAASYRGSAGAPGGSVPAATAAATADISASSAEPVPSKPSAAADTSAVQAPHTENPVLEEAPETTQVTPDTAGQTDAPVAPEETEIPQTSFQPGETEDMDGESEEDLFAPLTPSAPALQSEKLEDPAEDLLAGALADALGGHLAGRSPAAEEDTADTLTDAPRAEFPANEVSAPPGSESEVNTSQPIATAPEVKVPAERENPGVTAIEEEMARLLSEIGTQDRK